MVWDWFWIVLGGLGWFGEEEDDEEENGDDEELDVDARRSRDDDQGREGWRVAPWGPSTLTEPGSKFRASCIFSHTG